MDLKRITAGSVLVLILLSLCVYYYDYHESNLKYPSTAAIESYYPEGSLVFVSGTAVKQNSNGFNLRDGNNWSIEYNIISGKHVKPGDNVQLLGILGPSYTIKSTRAAVETGWGYEFIIFRSALAMIVLIFIFFRYWKFNFKTFEIIRLKETRACKSGRFAASKSKLEKNAQHFSTHKKIFDFFKILTGFLNHKNFLKKFLRRQ